MGRRTDLEMRADDIDSELYHVISKLEGLAEGPTRLHVTKQQAEALLEVADKIRTVRPMLRALMHPDDRAQTVGL